MRGVAIPPVSEKNLNAGQRNGVHLYTLRVQSHLFVLDSQIGTFRAILMRDLHKVSAHQCHFIFSVHVLNVGLHRERTKETSLLAMSPRELCQALPKPLSLVHHLVIAALLLTSQVQRISGDLPTIT